MGTELQLDPNQEDTAFLASASRISDSIRAWSDGEMRRMLSSIEYNTYRWLSDVKRGPQTFIPGPRRSWHAAWPSTSRGRHPHASGTLLGFHGGLAAEA